MFKLRKIRFFRDTGKTRELNHIKPGVELTSWNSGPGLIYNADTVSDDLPKVPLHEETTVKQAAIWQGDTKPMKGRRWADRATVTAPTEPNRFEVSKWDIKYRRCDCWLACGWCICAEGK